MSIDYDRYLRDHKTNVMKAYLWITESIGSEIQKYASSFWADQYRSQIEAHDASKTDPEEYYAYDDYFYNRKSSRSYMIVEDFQEAFLKHLHKNPHHWQHWVLIPDSSGEPQKAIFMPYNYVLEMVCDWFSFSLKSGIIDGIFDFYLERKSHIVLHHRSRQFLEFILDEMEKVIHARDEEGCYTCLLWYDSVK